MEIQIELKQCTKCGERNPATEEYFYNNKYTNKSKGTFYKLSNWCKECTKKNARKWAINNPEKMREAFRKCDSSERRKKIKRDFSRKQKENGYYKKYQQENKDKFTEYQKLRQMNKEHDITDQEWLECLEFFNDSCAYCGITEEQSLKEYGQQLHKEHVEHTGANDITNCVPACKGCNSQKWEYELNEWYTENNPVYSKRRYNKIIKWILSFVKV